MAIVVVPGPTILAGQSLSDGIDLSAGQLIRINAPPGWDFGAHLTFQVSTDGGGYNDLWRDGLEVTLPKFGPNRAIFLSQGQSGWPSLVWMKFRSGRALSPVIQLVNRVFSCVIQTP